MDNGISIRLDGAANIQAALKDIRQSVQKRILKSAMTHAVKPFVSGMRVAAPSNLGALGRSIGSRIKLYKDVVFAAVGPLTKYKETFVGTFPFSPPSPNTAKNKVNKPSKYAHLVEKGASPHFVPAPGYGRTRKASKVRGAKAAGGIPGWQHPGAKARPFMAPTAARYDGIVEGRFTDHVKKRIRIEWDRAKKKGKKFFATDKTGFGK